jgi:hypothetical protein
MLQENESPAAAPGTLACPADEPAAASADKLTVTPLERLRIPMGGQEIELQQVDYVHGGISLLRLRIREGRRFTGFDIDSVSAREWGEAMLRWAQRQER